MTADNLNSEEVENLSDLKRSKTNPVEIKQQNQHLQPP